MTQLPGAKELPPPPEELLTAGRSASCFITRGRERDALALMRAKPEVGVITPKPCEVCQAQPGLEAWERLWTAGKNWLSVTTDIDVVVRLCKARVDEAHLRLALQEDGPFVEGQRGGLVAHPAYSQLRVLNAEMVKLESLCGFTPSDRGRLGVGEVENVSPLAALLARRTAPRRAAQVPKRAAARQRSVGSGADQLD